MKSFNIIIPIFLFGILMGCASEPQKLILQDIPRSQRTVLMVLNFKNTTLKDRATQFQPWEFGLSSMMITDLESMGLFNILSQERLKDILEQQKLQLSGIVDEKQAIEVGKIAAAKYVLTGSFMEMYGTLRIESQVFSVEQGVQVGAASEIGGTDRFFSMQKTLVIKVSQLLGAVFQNEQLAKIEKNIETRSVDASLNNYAGEIALNKANEHKESGDTEKAEQLLKEAKQSFNRAIEYDPDYEKARKNLLKLSMGMPMTL